jgi:hypothetical protein
VERVILENGRAVAVRGQVSHEGKQVPLTVFAKAVVVACGAPYTPVLLAQSGVRSPALGQNLRLHPVTGVWGYFPDEDAEPWGGVMQARIGRDLADLDGRGYGVRIESASVHPAEIAVLGGWGGAYDFKETLRRARHWVPLAVLLRDRSRGHVRTSRWAPTTYHYALEAADVRHVRRGIEHAARALAFAGAAEIRTATSRAPRRVPVARGLARLRREPDDVRLVPPERHGRDGQRSQALGVRRDEPGARRARPLRARRELLPDAERREPDGHDRSDRTPRRARHRREPRSRLTIHEDVACAAAARSTNGTGCAMCASVAEPVRAAARDLRALRCVILGRWLIRRSAERPGLTSRPCRPTSSAS